jgi:hypothetical protein
MFYSIQIQGHLDGGWSKWFERMTMTTLESGDSVLTGDVIDQAALLGKTHRQKSTPPAPRVDATPVADQQRRQQ